MCRTQTVAAVVSGEHSCQNVFLRLHASVTTRLLIIRLKKKGKAYQISLVFLHQIHFVNETEHFSIGGVLQDGLQTRLVVVHVFLQLAALDIEYINKHLYVSENVVPLAGEVVLHERVLSDG